MYAVHVYVLQPNLPMPWNSESWLVKKWIPTKSDCMMIYEPCISQVR